MKCARPTLQANKMGSMVRTHKALSAINYIWFCLDFGNGKYWQSEYASKLYVKHLCFVSTARKRMWKWRDQEMGTVLFIVTIHKKRCQSKNCVRVRSVETKPYIHVFTMKMNHANVGTTGTLLWLFAYKYLNLKISCCHDWSVIWCIRMWHGSHLPVRRYVMLSHTFLPEYVLPVQLVGWFVLHVVPVAMRQSQP